MEQVLKKYRNSDTTSIILSRGEYKDILDGMDAAFVCHRIWTQTRFTFEPISYSLIIRLTMGVLHEVAC